MRKRKHTPPNVKRGGRKVVVRRTSKRRDFFMKFALVFAVLIVFSYIGAKWDRVVAKKVVVGTPAAPSHAQRAPASLPAEGPVRN